MDNPFVSKQHECLGENIKPCNPSVSIVSCVSKQPNKCEYINVNITYTCVEADNSTEICLPTGPNIHQVIIIQYLNLYNHFIANYTQHVLLAKYGKEIKKCFKFYSRK